MLYLRPYLIKQRDEQERRTLAAQILNQVDLTAPPIQNQETKTNR